MMTDDIKGLCERLEPTAESEELPSIMAGYKLADNQCLVALDEIGTGWIIARSEWMRGYDVLTECSTEDNGLNRNWDKGLSVGVYLVTTKPWSHRDYEGEWDCGIDVIRVEPLWSVECADRLESQAAEIERLREILRLDRKIADSNARRSAHFERHAAALAEALEPFANLADVEDEVGRNYPDDDRVWVVQSFGCQLGEMCIDDLHRARAALDAYRSGAAADVIAAIEAADQDFGKQSIAPDQSARISSLEAALREAREALTDIGMYGCGMFNQPAAMNGPNEIWLEKRIRQYERVAMDALSAIDAALNPTKLTTLN